MLPTLLAAALCLTSACQSPATNAADTSPSTEFDRGADGYDDSYFPFLGNGGYDVEHYKIVLDVDPFSNLIAGSTTIEAVATSALSRFNLDLSGLEVSAVRVDGELATFRREAHELKITPATPLALDQHFRVQVSYGGTPEVVPLPGLPIDGIGWMHEGELVITMSEPSGAMNWYPCNNHQLDKATHEFEITVPAEFTVAANGILESIRTLDDKRRFRFVASDPMATYLATVNVGRFEVEELEGPGGLPLTFYFPPATTEEVRAGFRRTPEMLEALTEWFGPYPFECYGGLVAGAGPPAALETQTLPVYGGTAPGIDVQIHELTHQWFGNSVSFSSWRDLWLAESFAAYAEWLWNAKFSNQDSIGERARRFYGFLAGLEYELMGDPGVEHLFGLGVYVRGPVAVHALRLELGDELFFKTLKTWTSTYQNQTRSAEDFIALTEKLSGRDLGDFFQGWLYEAELPDIPALGLIASEQAALAAEAKRKAAEAQEDSEQ